MSAFPLRDKTYMPNDSSYGVQEFARKNTQGNETVESRDDSALAELFITVSGHHRVRESPQRAIPASGDGSQAGSGSRRRWLTTWVTPSPRMLTP